jgi:Fur family transcriptional regulator, stress-responsive regulator
MTPQRELIFRVLHNNEMHPTADAVFAVAREQMPMISLKTVYQVLNDLVALGEIHSLDVGTGSIRFDPNVVEHDHLVCRACGRITDVASADVSPLPACDAHGFIIDAVDVTFRGLCAPCSQSAASAHPSPPPKNTK